MTITSDLKWSLHILHSCNSAKRKLGLLYRNFYQADQRTLTHLYKALVLPKLDYCSCVWDPSSSSLTAKLEAVQRFAAKLCSKQWSGDSHSLVSSLGWPPLQSRRLRQKAMLCRRIICVVHHLSQPILFSSPPHKPPDSPSSLSQGSICPHSCLPTLLLLICIQTMEQPATRYGFSIFPLLQTSPSLLLL